MKRVLGALLLVGLACGVAAAQAETKSKSEHKGASVKEHILDLSTQWAEAERDGDKAVIIEMRSRAPSSPPLNAGTAVRR